MVVRILPAALTLLAAAADGRGRHEAAYWLVVAAVPAAAVAALDLFGSLVEVTPRSSEEAERRALATFGALALALIVLAAATRSPARLDAGVPALGTSALAAAIALYGFQAALTVAAHVNGLRLALRAAD
jgi:hypothetical protein